VAKVVRSLVDNGALDLIARRLGLRDWGSSLRASIRDGIISPTDCHLQVQCATTLLRSFAQGPRRFSRWEVKTWKIYGRT
jgi:hypothetical protein